MSLSLRSIRPLLAALALVVAGSTEARAQSSASAALEGEVRVTSVAQSTEALLGGTLWFRVRDDLAIGGGAWALPSGTREGTLAASGLELDFGYGGVGAEWSGLPVEAIALRLLLGAGSGTTIDRATGSRVDSSGFFLFEPTAVARLPLGRRLHLTGHLGYRRTFDLDELPRVAADDLNAWVAGVGVRFSPF